MLICKGDQVPNRCKQTHSLFFRELPKIISKNWKMRKRWTRSEKSGVCFRLIFDHQCQKFIFRGETGYQTVLPQNFRIFLFFSNLLKSSVFNNSVTSSTTRVHSFQNQILTFFLHVLNGICTKIKKSCDFQNVIISLNKEC